MLCKIYSFRFVQLSFDVYSLWQEVLYICISSSWLSVCTLQFVLFLFLTHCRMQSPGNILASCLFKSDNIQGGGGGSRRTGWRRNRSDIRGVWEMKSLISARIASESESRATLPVSDATSHSQLFGSCHNKSIKLLQQACVQVLLAHRRSH